MNRSLLLLGALAGAALACVAPAAAQSTLTLDLAGNSAYVYRGMILTNRAVVQGDVGLTVPAGGVTFSAGTWVNVEPRRYDGPRAISMTAGEEGPNLTEVDVWADATRSFGPLSVTAGVTRFAYPNPEVITPADNTTELYARFGLPDVPFAPRLSINQDVERVRGTYLEGSLSQTVTGSAGVPLAFGATVGWSAGQEAGADSSETFYFAEKGVTHADLSMAVPLTRGTLTVTPSAHLVLFWDPLIRLVEPEVERDATVWVGITATWTLPLSRARR